MLPDIMKRKTEIPTNFTISDRVRKWAALHNFHRLDEHFEYFILKAEANGYTYVSWDAAFITAIRDDWARLRTAKPANGHNIIELGKSLGLEARPGEEMESFQRRVMDARH